MNPTTVLPFTVESRESEAIAERYRNAYAEARKAATFADSVKYGSIFLAGVVIIAAILVRQVIPAERFEFPMISASMVVGIILLTLIAHLWSSIYQLQARLLETAIDSAVNSSPLLSNAQKAAILGATEQPLIPGAADSRAKAA